MTNVIGYKENRKYLWDCLVSLREVIKDDKDKIEQREAYIKEVNLYSEFLNRFIH